MTQGSLGTLSVLFTDVVGSTAQRVALGDDRADELHRVHDRVVADAVSSVGGTVVKGLGDGSMATFSSAADAVAAAIAVQQGVERHSRTAGEGQSFAVRIGVSIGDVTVEEGDVFGTPVVEASRLCAAATGGEILVAELVRMLARSRGGFTFDPIGELDLKGLPEPIPTCRVAWLPSVEPVGVAERVPLPSLMVGSAATAYVGRGGLIDSLHDRLRQTLGGGCHTVLLAGEPGIGKTRTSSELARAAFAGGAVVLYGRCDEDMGVPYQPFVEALDWYARHLTVDTPLGRLPGELTRLVPELSTLSTDIGSAVVSDPRSEEYRLFEAVTSWLITASAATGLVLVLDDLHWAARPTLQLLVHVLRAAEESPEARLLVVATYRDTDVDRSHPLSAVLADLRRLPSVERVAVEALGVDDVLHLVEIAAGQEIDADTHALAQVVHAETEGNPFFVGEVLRHLVETGAVRRVDDRWIVDVVGMEVPEGVRDVVGRRVSRLSADANSVLSVAAVIGRDVTLDVLMAVSELGEDQVVDALDEGVRARLLEELGADRFRFAHALVRTTLYEELSATRRRRLHRRVADALEKIHGDDVVALAHHTMQAGPDGGDISRAARYSIAAAEQALDARALADAEARFLQALEMLDDSDAPDEELILLATCGLGQAQRDQGKAEFRETLFGAARRAKAIGSTALLARAALENHRGYPSSIGNVDEERVELIEAALEAIGPAPSVQRARLLGLLSSELLCGDHHRKRELAFEAEALARSLGDPTTLAHVLVLTTMPLVHVDGFDEQLVRVKESVELADLVGDPGLGCLARMYCSSALLANGEIPASRTMIDDAVALAAEASPSVAWLAHAHALRYVVGESDVATSTAANDACLAMGEALGAPDRSNWWAAVAFGLILASSGDLSDLADITEVYADEYSGTLTWRLGHTWALCDAGRVDEARDVLARYVDIERLEAEAFPFQGVFAVATAAWKVGDRQLAATARERLEPHRDKWAHYYLLVNGPITIALGMAAATMEDYDDAVALITEGIDSLKSNGFPMWAQPISLELVEVLRRRNAPGDAERRADILRGIIEHTERTGADALAARARTMLAELG